LTPFFFYSTQNPFSHRISPLRILMLSLLPCPYLPISLSRPILVDAICPFLLDKRIASLLFFGRFGLIFIRRNPVPLPFVTLCQPLANLCPCSFLLLSIPYPSRETPREFGRYLRPPFSFSWKALASLRYCRCFSRGSCQHRFCWIRPQPS